VHLHGAPSPPWSHWVLALLVVVVPVLLYAEAVRTRRRRLGREWSRWRSAALAAGAVAAGVAVSPPVTAFARADPVGHVLQHLLLGMYAPLAVVLSAPVTLVLGASVPRFGRRLAALLHARPVRLLSSPVTAAAVHVGSLYVLYLTPLYRVAHDREPVHALVALHVVLAGCVYAWALVGPDPAPRRPGVPLRAAVLVGSAAAHAVLAKLLYARAAELPPGAGLPAGRVEVAAQWMYYGGDVAELALAVLLFAEWYRRRARADTGPAVLAPRAPA
jgi:putative membrane protein